MPRVARMYSKTITETYHIIIRGINKQDIFFDDSDKEKFIDIIKKIKEEFKFELYLYVLMNNHVHLVIHDINNQMSNIMHKVCLIYAMYFNKKYERVGHLFQNRFKSINVINKSNLFNLVKYIHNNSYKEKMSSITGYKWSSYKEYVNKKEKGITDTDFILELFDQDRDKAIERFIKYNNRDSQKEYIEIELICGNRITDEDAIQYIKENLKINNVLEIHKFNKTIRDSYIYRISKIKGLYKGQVARILGISERTIERIIEKNKRADLSLNPTSLSDLDLSQNLPK